MFLTSVVLTFATLAAAQAQPAATAAGDALRVNTVLLPDGRLQIWEISRDRMARLPVGPATSVSFTAEQAITIARSWLSRQVPETKEWTVVTRVLRRFGAARDGTLAPNGWYYAVQLEPAKRQPAPPSAPSSADEFWVVVLLDGTVVESNTVDVRQPARISGASPAQGDTTVFSASPGSGVVVPRPIVRPVPHYTSAAMRARVQGRVSLSCIVNTEGMCEDIRVTESLDTVHGLDAEAVWSVLQWRFTPGTVDGKPVRVRIVIQLEFNLRDNRK
ncbi:MAG: energy transducer TonB [Vicinamibacterales bacterium]